jgi:hypothetical protein
VWSGGWGHLVVSVRAQMQRAAPGRGGDAAIILAVRAGGAGGAAARIL